MLEKKYQEKCRAFNRSSKLFPQQLKAPCLLRGVETPIISVGTGGIYPRAPHFTQQISWRTKKWVLHI